LSASAGSAGTALTFTLGKTTGTAFLTPSGTNVVYLGTIQVGSGSAATLKLGGGVTVGTTGGATLAFTAQTGGNTLDLNSFSVTGAANTIALGGSTQLSIAATGGGTFTGTGAGTLSLLGVSLTSAMFSNNFGTYSTLGLCPFFLCVI